MQVKRAYGALSLCFKTFFLSCPIANKCKALPSMSFHPSKTNSPPEALAQGRGCCIGQEPSEVRPVCGFLEEALGSQLLIRKLVTGYCGGRKSWY